MDKSSIVRTMVAGLLWGLIILCFITMTRANGMMARNLSLIKSGTVSPEQIATERIIAETARSFVYNWATYNGDEQDYKSRLQKFGKYESYKLGSIQKCNSVEPLQIDKIDKNIYRVKLSVDVSRVTTVSETEAYLISSDQIIKKEQTASGVMVSVWKNYQETVEVTIKKGEELNDLTILGYPVLTASTSLKNAAVKDMVENNQPPQGFVTFGKQMLDLYFRGEDLSNYSQEEITSLGGYTLDKCELIGYEEDDGIITSLFKTTISSNNGAVKNMEQYVVVEADKSGDKWQLIRIGSY